MPNKLEIILAMYKREVVDVTRNYKTWTAFLKTAAFNYKYSFPEQLLIYAQKPGATACADIEFWNKRMDRWVNRGTKGIALINSRTNGQKLRYVFDVSDTNSRDGREVPIWRMSKESEKDVKESLENSFGETSVSSTEYVFDNTARNVVEDNMTDYASTLSDVVGGSLLEGFDEDNLSVRLKNAIASSVGYMMLYRCGLDADDFYDFEDFKYVFDFNTHETVNLLGSAVSSMSEMILRDIESTVRNFEKNQKKLNRTFVKSQENDYDKGAKTKTQPERSEKNENTNHLQTGRRLSDTELNPAERGHSTSWQVRSNEEGVSSQEQGSDVQSSSDQRRADSSSQGSGSTGERNVGQNNLTDGTGAGSQRADERNQSALVGADDEQYSAFGRGNGAQGLDLQLSGHDFDAHWNGIEYFHQNKEKNELIHEYLSPHREEIASFFESHSDSKERSNFIMSFFNSKPFEMTLSNGIKAGFEAYSDAIYLWRGDKEKPERESWERWHQISRAVFGMILLEQWTEPEALLLPSEESQIEFIGDKVKDGVLPLPQAAIDYLIGVGSSYSEGKFRAYRHFTEFHTRDENIAFLKNEYGTGGGTDAIPGSGYWESHDSKGIEISDHYSVPERRILLKWNEVSKRLTELIKLDRYLSPKEKEMYPQWLENKLIEEAERKKTNEIRQFINNASEEEQATKEYRYEFHLGDTVYIGADEYTILSLEDPVILSDNQFPLFNKEFSQSDFEKTVKESSANNHLRVEVEVERPITESTYEIEVDESNKPDFLIQYEQVKKENPDGVLMLHTGGFYFAFGDDAKIITKYTHHTAPKKNFYGNVFTPCCQVLDFNLSYCQKELCENNNISIVVMEFDKGVVDRFPTPSVDITETFDVDYTDAFFVNDGSSNVEWVYFNPDGNEGKGQFVNNLITYDDILKAKELHSDEKAFFDYLGAVARQTLSDYDTKEYKNDYEYFHSAVDLTDCTKETMESLIAEAEKGLELPERENSQYNSLYSGYLEVKNEEPDKIVLYQVGDFFEAFNDDAKVVAEALDLTLTSRPISDTERAALVGLPKHSLETFLNMLTDRGHDVVLSSVENGERKETTIISTNKEDPVESKPVGRIDYLAFNGKVRESIEYTSEYKFVKDIKEENYYGVPMSIYVYADKDGKAIGRSFVSSLDPPPFGFKVIPSPYLQVDERSDVDDSFDDINPAVIRENLAERGIVNGEVVDEEALNNSPFIQQVMSDVEKIEDEDYSQYIGRELTIDGSKFRIEKYYPFAKEFSMLDLSSVYPLSRVEKVDFVLQLLKEQEKGYETEVVDVLPAVENGLPYDVVIQKISTLKPEVPESQKHDFVITDDNLGVGGAKEKFKRNMEAINLLHELQFDGRLATPEEQEILSKYVGFGGLADAFDETKDNWKDEFTELYTTLSPEEYASARESTLTAFYTPPVVIRAMYKALENMGFTNGNILEPSCGVGNFIGMKPDSMKNSKIYGVELDTLTGRIAQQLYQKSNIAVQGYEQTNLPDSFFDVAIGNVPFGQFKVLDKKYDKHNWVIHDYFFGKTLDKVRPGGVIAFITSSNTLDKRNSKVRRYIAQRAEFLGAIRLPNDTFKANAGTKVVSDIIFLQKRDTLVNDEPSWVYTGTDENGFTLNQYFIDNPEMVLGELTIESSPYGPALTCKAYENTSLEELLEGAIQNIHAEIKEFEIDEIGETEEDLSVPADPNVRNFSYTIVEDKIYYRQNSRMTPVSVTATAENRIKGMIQIRDAVRHLITLQTDDYPESSIKSAQDKLNTLYDDFTKKYGLLNSRGNKAAFSEDSSYCLLCSLEVIGENGELKRKADMFTKRTIKPHIKVTSVETASEALAVSLGEKACVDMPYMSELTGKSEKEIFDALKGVIFLNPLYKEGLYREEKYLTADEYLSGNIREKLKTAEEMAENNPDDYAVNVEALKKVQPTELTASEISVRLGATWLSEEDIEDFMFELLKTPRYAQYNIKVHYSPYTAEWNIENKSFDRQNVIAYTTYGTDRASAYKIIEETLNLRDVRIFDYVEDENGNRKPVLNKKDTAIAQSKQELIKQAFQDWIWKDPERRQRLVKLYNERFNSMRAREFDGSHITFSGMNPEITLRTHQRNAVARIMYGGNTLLAHVVGAGKTFEIVAAAQESKRLGLCNKSLIVVPNHLTEQWASEYLQLYPSANILVATKKDFETKNRKKFCARIATGDYDAVIIGHSQFEKIPISLERQRNMLEDQIFEITNGIAELKENNGERFSIKQFEKTKKSLEAKLDKLNDQTRKDDVVTFEELGVDRLFIDEAHFYKNLYLYTKMRNVGGIAQTEAQKSSDLYMKCRYLDEITGGKGIIFATGTPVSNSMVELYTMQRYLQYDTLSEKHLQHFDAWASTFGETVTAIELAPEGTGYRAKTRFAKFYNLPELMMMFRQIADIQTADMLKLPVPEAIRKNIALEPSQMQRDIVASLGERAEAVRNKMVDTSIDNMLLITNDGRKLALDQRLYNPMLPDDDNSKVSVCADNVFDIWERTSDSKSTQLVFCDLSTPHNDGKFNVYDDLKKKLLAKGIPESEIAFIHTADTEVKKKELFSKVRTGNVRVLIGSTFKMGAGTNVQRKLIALHHLDCPWRPSDLEQREGRIIRQGNENPQVEIFTYVTKDTFDSYLYQLVENKQKFIGQIMTSKSPVRSAEDVDEQALSYAEIKALATGNPYIKEKMDLDVSVAKLKLLKQNHLGQIHNLEDKLIMVYPQEIKRLEERITGYERDIANSKSNSIMTADGFYPMVIEGVNHTEKKAAGSALLAACNALRSQEPKHIGSYRGFDLELAFQPLEKQYVLTLVGELRHSTPLGSDWSGNIMRIDNLISKLPERLEATKEKLAETYKQIENAKELVEKPFPQEEELTEKSKRLAELNALLDMGEKGNEIVDGEIENNEPEKDKKRDLER